MEEIFIKTLEDELKTLNINYTSEMLNKSFEYFLQMQKVNESLNLTRITSPLDVAIKHFADCLSVLSRVDIPKNSKVIDVGTGAGFPAVPLAIFRPDLDVLAIDSTGKKINFVSSACKDLDIPIKTMCARAEELGRNKQHRGKYNYVFSRAVAPLNILLELCVPLLCLGGYFAAYKGNNADNECVAAENAINVLNLEHTAFNLTLNNEIRNILLYKLTSACPLTYPREYRKIKASPL